MKVLTAVIAFENHHETDGIHAHAFVNISKKIMVTDTSNFMFANKHYNFEFISSSIKGFFYVTKECDHFYYYGKIDDYMKSRENLMKKIL